MHTGDDFSRCVWSAWIQMVLASAIWALGTARPTIFISPVLQLGEYQNWLWRIVAKVVAYDFERNWLQYEGSTIPSSESLTHAAIYESDPKAGAVIHCHDSKLWAALLNQAPTTSKTIDYGTPQLAYEIMRLFKQSDVRSRKILVMAGHAAGILTLGKDLEEAFAVLMHERKKSTWKRVKGQTGDWAARCVDSDMRGRTLSTRAQKTFRPEW
jgi:hypothetical protein